jgi:LysM repeat protein
MPTTTTAAAGAWRRPAVRAVVAACLLGATAVGCGELQPVEWTRASSPTVIIDVDLSTTTVPGGGTRGEPRRARYTVQPGDTLGSIATLYGVTQDALMAANMISDPNRLEAGMELRIPGPNATVPPPWLQESGTSQWGGRG